MSTPEPKPAAKPFKLRWYQYSLRSLFLLTFLVAVGMSYVAVTMKNQRRQKAAADAIEKAGGHIKSERTWLGNLLRDDSLVSVTEVELDGPAVSDARLVHLKALSQLQALLLGNTNVTDAGLVRLQGLNRLRYLYLSGTKVTDAGLVHLQGLTQLRELQFDNTKVTDQGVKNLKQALPKCMINTTVPQPNRVQ